MIENLLYFAFGLLLAIFVGLLIVPLIWNRAITLTERNLTKRANPDIRAKVAENDRRFAELAINNQKSAATKRVLEKINAELEVELAKHRDQIKTLKAELRNLKQNTTNTKTDSNTLKTQITDLAAEMAAITAKLEGDDSGILKALNAKDAKGNDKNSLAQKIIILRKKIG
jgi:chromosome segregation ATPase